MNRIPPSRHVNPSTAARATASVGVLKEVSKPKALTGSLEHYQELAFPLPREFRQELAMARGLVTEGKAIRPSLSSGPRDPNCEPGGVEIRWKAKGDVRVPGIKCFARVFPVRAGWVRKHESLEVDASEGTLRYLFLDMPLEVALLDDGGRFDAACEP